MIKCKIFLTGLQMFEVITDHNPLIPILNTHLLDKVENPRLHQRLMAYSFKAEWCKGTTNSAPDALSISPVMEPHKTELITEYDEDNTSAPTMSEIRTVSNERSESLRLQELRQQALQDEYQYLWQIIMKGIPDHCSQVPELIRHYWQVRHHLTINDDLMVNRCHLVIPSSMRKSILDQLHREHQGMVRTKQRAHLTLYWPGIHNDIENMVGPSTVKPKRDNPAEIETITPI